MSKLHQQIALMSAIATAAFSGAGHRRPPSNKPRWRANEGQKRQAANIAIVKRRKLNRIARRSRRYNLRHGQ